MSHHYDALMSYTRFDDQNDGAFLTAFRERLSYEVRAHSGQEFRIFQDTEDIKWGEQFEQRIDAALDTITFFIPILTPSFFKSTFCRYELETFLTREQELGCGDLVLPVYYIEVAALEDKHLRADDPLAQTLAARQRIDWRDLRFESFEEPQVRRMLAQMAQQIARRIVAQERERQQHEAAEQRRGGAEERQRRAAEATEQRRREAEAAPQEHQVREAPAIYQKRDYWLIFWWVLATTLSGAVGGAVGIAMGDDVFSVALNDFDLDRDRAQSITWGMLGIVLGMMIGLGQWLVLRRHIAQGAWWIVATTLGGVIGGAMGSAVGYAVFGAVGSLVGVGVGSAVGGATVGVAQWLVLRRHFTQGAWWIVATTLGIVVGVSMGGGMVNVVGFAGGRTASGAVGSAVGGAIFGFVTAFVLEWLLRTQRKSPS
jgi:hypothetical protein